MRVRDQITLTNCDREPIHIPGSIQAHGFLVQLSDKDFRIKIVSENAAQFLGTSAEDLLDMEIFEIVGPEQRDNLRSVLASNDVSKQNPIKIALNVAGVEKKFDCVASNYKEKLILEFEPSAIQSDLEFKNFYLVATKAVERLRAAENLGSLQQATVDEIRRITNFDRVVIYQFDRSWNGHVVSESKAEAAQTYLDLHFPSSDIPKQVRDLYSINPIRNIPTTNYEPSRLVGSDPEEAQDLDLSLCGLRNVSPIHVEYLNNMGVHASMSTPIFKNGKLWGLVSCSHENGSNYVSYEKRAVCIFLASTLSSLLPFFEDRDDHQLRSKLFKVHNQLVASMAESEKFVDGLFKRGEDLLELTNASGVAAYVDSEWRIFGSVPKPEDLERIKETAMSEFDDDIFFTDSIKEFLPNTKELSLTASGILAFPISRSHSNLILWFRPEVTQTVKWGGNPNKPVEIENDIQVLHPRKSFELWKETVHQKSLPWRSEEIEAARNLRFAISDIVLQRVEQVTKLNTELERSNVELDSFAYAASHDLKEPLRGISNYAMMVIREEETMKPKSRERLETILRLTQRAENLINSLLDYSQVGRSDLVLEEIPLKQIVNTAIDTIRSLADENNVKVTVGELPTVRADKTQLTEVFTNLFVNAIKYNTSAEKTISVQTRRTPADSVMIAIEVSDNGIGIPEQFRNSVFKIFKRLHARGDFGGGSGTGLTIVKKIVERHGGSISIESNPGQGTTFLILLPRIVSGH